MGSAFLGHDLPSSPVYGVRSAAGCHRRCSLRERCLYWTWADVSGAPEHGGACWLKAAGAEDDLAREPARVSGPRHCPLCLLHGLRYHRGVHQVEFQYCLPSTVVSRYFTLVQSHFSM